MRFFVEQARRKVFDAARGVASDSESDREADEPMQLAIWNAVKALVPRERGGSIWWNCIDGSFPGLSRFA